MLNVNSSLSPYSSSVKLAAIFCDHLLFVTFECHCKFEKQRRFFISDPLLEKSLLSTRSMYCYFHKEHFGFRTTAFICSPSTETARFILRSTIWFILINQQSRCGAIRKINRVQIFFISLRNLPVLSFISFVSSVVPHSLQGSC